MKWLIKTYQSTRLQNGSSIFFYRTGGSGFQNWNTRTPTTLKRKVLRELGNRSRKFKKKAKLFNILKNISYFAKIHFFLLLWDPFVEA
jgi:hypothetical protein